MIIGVLALQGAFIEHIHMFRSLDIEAVEIRLPGEMSTIEGLVIPGGESTTMMKLMNSYKMIDPIKKFARQHKPVWGTCAGMICIANDVRNPDLSPMETLGLMNVTVKRNAFGRQVDSFEIDLKMSIFKDRPFPGVFIRSPYIEKAGRGVEVIASLPDGRIVAARQKNLLATSFHPELTNDNRVHQYFADMIRA